MPDQPTLAFDMPKARPGRPPSLDKVLQTLLDCALRATGLEAGSISLLDKKSDRFIFTVERDLCKECPGAQPGPLRGFQRVRRQVARSGRPVLAKRLSEYPGLSRSVGAKAGLCSYVCVPLVSNDEILGVLEMAGRDTELTNSEMKRVTSLASEVAAALKHYLLGEETRTAVAAERRRIARELHDSISQLLFSITLDCEVAYSLVEREPVEAKAHMERVGEKAKQAGMEIRSLLNELHPAAQWGRGLAEALANYIRVLNRDNGISVMFRVSGEGVLNPAIEDQWFRVAQEALNNVMKHSGATSALVELTFMPELVRLSIEDDGIGFDPSKFVPGKTNLGLASMRERVEGLGGSLSVESKPGEGTKVTAEVPQREVYG